MKRGLTRGGMKLEPFLLILARRLTGEARVGTPERVMNGELYYLGGGYWRVIHNEEADRLYLVNPDYTYEEIATIERAMFLLLSTTDARREP